MALMRLSCVFNLLISVVTNSDTIITLWQLKNIIFTPSSPRRALLDLLWIITTLWWKTLLWFLYKQNVRFLSIRVLEKTAFTVSKGVWHLLPYLDQGLLVRRFELTKLSFFPFLPTKKRNFEAGVFFILGHTFLWIDCVTKQWGVCSQEQPVAG